MYIFKNLTISNSKHCRKYLIQLLKENSPKFRWNNEIEKNKKKKIK